MQVRQLKGTFLGLFNWELLTISWLLLTYLGCGPDIAEVRKRSGVRYERNHRHITGNSFLEGQMTDLTSESFVHDQQLYSTAVYFYLQPSGIGNQKVSSAAIVNVQLFHRKLSSTPSIGNNCELRHFALSFSITFMAIVTSFGGLVRY